MQKFTINCRGIIDKKKESISMTDPIIICKFSSKCNNCGTWLMQGDNVRYIVNLQKIQCIECPEPIDDDDDSRLIIEETDPDFYLK